jgi:hypothetical protein
MFGLNLSVYHLIESMSTDFVTSKSVIKHWFTSLNNKRLVDVLLIFIYINLKNLKSIFIHFKGDPMSH